MENQVNESLDFDAICRICLKIKENFISIFENGSVEKLKTYCEMLEECASVHVSTDDSLPKNLCSQCSENLEQNYKFKTQCLWSEKLLQRLNSTKISNSLLNSDDSKANAVPAECDIFIKEELIEYIDDFDDLPQSDDHEINKHECVECSIEFPSKFDYIEHNKLVHLICQFCNNRYSSAFVLKRHCRGTICKICKKDLECLKNLEQHRSEHKNLTYLCNICGEIFTNRHRFRWHRQGHINKTFLCPSCGETFNSRENFNIHKRMHKGENQCHICDAKFTKHSSLESHLISHSEERKFECNICKSTYKWKEQLTRHKLTHTIELNFCCEICDKRFKTKCGLREHNRTHSGERKYVCTYCNKGFNRGNHLKVHLRTHTGDKPYVCSRCGRAFTTKHALKSHLKTHTDSPE